MDSGFARCAPRNDTVDGQDFTHLTGHSRDKRESMPETSISPDMAKVGCVYILASMTRGTLYVGVTSDLAGRIWEHRNGVKSGFASRYGVVRLVHFEIFDDISDAIAREKALKKWR